MSPKQKLEEWKKLSDAATAGPWKNELNFTETEDSHEYAIVQTNELNRVCDVYSHTDVYSRNFRHHEKNARFIAASRTAIPELIAEVERLNDEIENMKIEFGEMLDR